MVNVEIVERLREAAREHGEVCDLLKTLAGCFPFFSDGNSEFVGKELDRLYLRSVILAAEFVEYDSLHRDGES